MDILKYDLFSSKFYFNMGIQKYKRGTFLGLSLSVLATVVVLFYFFYLFDQYFNNMINPKFRSQSFITVNSKEVPLTTDLHILLNLDIVRYSGPLEYGFYSIDFSIINKFTLLLENSDEYTIHSSIQINTYCCLDIDNLKITIPNNCASQTEIDNIINGLDSFFYLKLKSQQFNTASKMIQTNYRNIYNYLSSNQFFVNTKSTQKKGNQKKMQETFSSPIQYNQISQTFNNQFSLEQGLGPQSQVILQIDEIVQEFEIQFPTFTEIFALVNGVAALVTVLRHFDRRVSSQAIRKKQIQAKILQDVSLFVTIDEYQASQNQTYVIYYPQFYYQDTKNNIFQTIDLDVVKLSNYTFLLDSINENQIYSTNYINLYGCLDQDDLKTTIPNNCPSQTEIDDAINSLDLNKLEKHIQLLIVQLPYYQYYEHLNLGDQSQFRAIFFRMRLHSHLQYSFGPKSQVMILIDEIIQQFQIQYPTFTEILTLIHSIS
ncbi:hypothetical protein ABPG72_001684 [Tetrahymena utriculariae]